jgi:hypothetical protein
MRAPRCHSCGRFYSSRGVCHVRGPSRAAVLAVYAMAAFLFVAPFVLIAAQIAGS